MCGVMKTVWIPEAPNHLGVYANASDYSASGEWANSRMYPTTTIASKAWQFPTQGACQTWCETYPHPVFVPKEHCFAD